MRTSMVTSAGLVSILFSSLALISVLQPTTQMRILAIVLLLIGLGLAFSAERIGSLASIPLTIGAVLASIRAAWLVGELEWAAGNGWLAVGIWLLLFGAASFWVMRRSLLVREKTVVLVRRQDGEFLQITGPTSVLSIPTFGAVCAHLPLYNLKTEAKVEQINTRKLDDIKMMRVRVHYEIDDPTSVYSNLPNRSQLIEEMATQMQTDPGKAALDPRFWGQLLDNRICQATDDLLREVIWHEENKGPVDVSKERETLAELLMSHLQDRTSSWGLTITDVKFEVVDLDPEQIKRSKRDKDREVAEAEHKARMAAIEIKARGEAEAEVQAITVEKWIAAIQNQVPGLSRDAVEQIVRNVLQEMNEQRSRIDFLAMGQPGAANGNKN